MGSWEMGRNQGSKVKETTWRDDPCLTLKSPKKKHQKPGASERSPERLPGCVNMPVTGNIIEVPLPLVNVLVSQRNIQRS